MKKHKHTMSTTVDRYREQKKRLADKIQARRDHKDTLFRMLFSSRENLLSLYNAVNGTHYTDPTALKVVTLENAVYMNMKNDQAFLLDFHLNLYEHQSTWNPNMPLRFLLYVAKEYQMLIRNQTIYSSALVSLPTPHFIVFYNGTVKKEDCWTNYLSEAYENLAGEPNLELKVITLNINEGHNKELMEQCQILREYAQYVAKVREFAGNTELNAAVELAVNECIQNNILAEFLRKHKSEVIAMSIFEYDKEEEEKKLREAEYEAGYDEGKKEIIRRMLEAGESVEKITQYTGYKTSELQKLLKEF